MAKCPDCGKEKVKYDDPEKLESHKQANHWKKYREKQHGQSGQNRERR